MNEKAYKEKCERKQKVRITFETTIPGYNADGAPLQALSYIAFKIAGFVMSPADFHNVKLEQIEEYEKHQSEKGISLIYAILNEAKSRIIERVTFDYCEKIDCFRELISQLDDQSIDSTVELTECENIINILSNSKSSVRSWLE